MDVLALLASAGLGLVAGYGGFELQERSRRRRHSLALKTALRSEVQRSERVLATYVYLWDHESEPTPTVVAELRRLCAESGLWGDEDPKTRAIAEHSDEDLAAVIRHPSPAPTAGWMFQGSGSGMPVRAATSRRDPGCRAGARRPRETWDKPSRVSDFAAAFSCSVAASRSLLCSQELRSRRASNRPPWSLL